MLGPDGKPMLDQYGNPIMISMQVVLGPDGKPMLGPDGKPIYQKMVMVYGPDGKPMLGPDGKPIFKPLTDESMKAMMKALRKDIKQPYHVGDILKNHHFNGTNGTKIYQP